MQPFAKASPHKAKKRSVLFLKDCKEAVTDTLDSFELENVVCAAKNGYDLPRCFAMWARIVYIGYVHHDFT